MNILLMAPALFIILLLSVGLRATCQYIFYCALLQVISEFLYFIVLLCLYKIVNIRYTISSIKSCCLYGSFIWSWSSIFLCLDSQLAFNTWRYLSKSLFSLKFIITPYSSPTLCLPLSMVKVSLINFYKKKRLYLVIK